MGEGVRLKSPSKKKRKKGVGVMGHYNKLFRTSEIARFISPRVILGKHKNGE